MERYNYVDIDAENVGGGILTMWNPVKVQLISNESTRYSLYIVMKYLGSNDPILCTNVYVPQMMYDNLNFIQSFENLQKYTQSQNGYW